jgi:hypothetical protein
MAFDSTIWMPRRDFAVPVGVEQSPQFHEKELDVRTPAGTGTGISFHEGNALPFTK